LKKEFRVICTDMEIRAEGEKPKIVGYAARFNELSDPIYGFFREKIKPGAFTNALKKSDVRALFNHDPNYVLGRAKNGTLKLQEDEIGLRYEITPPETQWANDLVKSIERGDINQSSFAFTVAKDEWDETGEMAIRTVIEYEELFDVSPVTFPAYPTTSTGVRSAEDVYNAHIAKVQADQAAEEQRKAQASLRRRKLELIEKSL